MNEKVKIGKIKRSINTSETKFDGSGEYCFEYYCGENLNSILRKICKLVSSTKNIVNVEFVNGVIKIYLQNGDVLETSSLDVRYYTKQEIDNFLQNFSSSFIELNDTPNDYSGNGGKTVVVNQTEDGLEFIDLPQGFSGDYNDLINKPFLQGEEGVDIENPQNNDFVFKTKFTSNLDDSLNTVQVGGLPATTMGSLKGQSLRKIIEDMVAPTLNPTLTNPSVVSFTRTPSSTIYETGSSQTFSFITNFSRGSINPQYSASSPFRSGLANAYNYTGQGLPSLVPSTSNSNTQSGINVVINNGTNSWSVSVSYDGGVQPYNNKGGIFSTPLSAGTTSAISNTLTGIYPVFYYKSSSPITASLMKTAIETNQATKLVISSTGTINITFNANGEYIAFAYPNSSTTKTVWYVNPLNNGSIGGVSNLFGSSQVQSINSPNGFWSNINYKIHVSNFATTTSSDVMELRNS